jgi:hypothetical protein
MTEACGVLKVREPRNVLSIEVSRLVHPIYEAITLLLTGSSPVGATFPRCEMFGDAVFVPQARAS